MRKLIAKAITNNAGMLVAGIVAFSLSVLLPFYECDAAWAQRMGAVMVGIGILCLSRPRLAGSEIHPTILGETGFSVYTKEHWASLGKPVHPTVIEQERNKFAVEVMGPAFTLLGTLLSGFGDLLVKPFLG